MKRTACILVWIMSSVFLANITFARPITIPQEYTVMHDIAQDWLVYDGGYGGYVPYMKDRHTRVKTLSFWLDSKKNAPYTLLLYAESNTYLYIQKSLAYRFNRTGWHHFSIDSLQKIYGQESLFCTFYDVGYRLPLPSITIVIRTKKIQLQESNLPTKVATLDRTLRPNDHKDWATLALLFVLVCYTALFNYNPKTFTSFFSGRSSLSTLSRKDPSLIQKPFNGINLAYLAAQGLLVSYFYMVWAVYQDNSLEFLWTDFKSPFAGLVLNQLAYWLLAWGILVGKLLGLLFFGRLLNVERQIVYVHYFEYIRFSQIFYVGFTGIAGLVFCCYGEYNKAFFDIARYFVPLFHLFQAFMMSFFVIKQVQFLNLYIFYYLCTTELTPWLIGVKMLLF